jgi:hypothetical protein
MTECTQKYKCKNFGYSPACTDGVDRPNGCYAYTERDVANDIYTPEYQRGYEDGYAACLREIEEKKDSEYKTLMKGLIRKTQK